MKLKALCLAAASGLILTACATAPPGQPAPAPGYGDGRYDNDRYGDGRYDNGRYNDGRYGDGRHDDRRRQNGRHGDPRYTGNDGYNQAPGARGERYYDERARRYYYYDQRTGNTYWANGELRSR